MENRDRRTYEAMKEKFATGPSTTTPWRGGRKGERKREEEKGGGGRE